jgi:hypothetical protein
MDRLDTLRERRLRIQRLDRSGITQGGSKCRPQNRATTPLDGQKQTAPAIPCTWVQVVHARRGLHAGIDALRETWGMLIAAIRILSSVVERASEELPAKATSLAL